MLKSLHPSTAQGEENESKPFASKFAPPPPAITRFEPSRGLIGWLAVLCLALVLLPGLSRAQTLDPDFNPNANNQVYAAVAVGDHYWVGGQFLGIGGENRRYLVRLHANGSVDTSVPDLQLNNTVYVIRHDAANNHLYVGGGFTEVAGSARPYLLRLDASTGALDTSFQPLQGVDVPTVGGHFVRDVLVHGDKVLIGGQFTGDGSADALPNYLAQLERSNGARDTGFNPLALNRDVGSLLRQADGKLVIGGYFDNVDVSAAQDGSDRRGFLIRLEANGRPDPSFHDSKLDRAAIHLVPGSGDSFYVAGRFTQVGGNAQTRIAQLNADGTPVDAATFANPDIDDDVYALARQADGKLLIGGHFTQIGSGTRHYLARLNADGTLDTSFGDVGLNDQINFNGLLPLPGNRLLIGGSFTEVLSEERNHIAMLRLSSTTHTVSASVPGGNGSVTPGSQNITSGQTASFTLSANTGYAVDTGNVGGDCPAGSFSGNTYTTGTITADCSVEFAFRQQTTTHTVSASVPGGNGSVTPGSQNITSGQTASFTLSPDTGYAVDTGNVGGDCPAGSFSGNTYTTGTITADCSVVFAFRQQTIPTHQITTAANPTAGGNVICNPNPVPNGGSTTCTATANTGYVFDSFSGACSGGTCVLNNVTAPLSVTANFTLAAPGDHTITATVDPTAAGSLICNPNPVPDGGDTTCTFTPASGYELVQFIGCSQIGSSNQCTLTNVSAATTVSVQARLGTRAAPVLVPVNGDLARALLLLALASLGLAALQRRGH